jgi:hypothetical protein
MIPWIAVGVGVWIGLVVLALRISAAADRSVPCPREKQPGRGGRRLLNVARLTEPDRSTRSAD